MINLRMLALASALLLLLPVAAWAYPSGDEMVVEGGAQGVLEITDVALAELGDPRTVEPNSTFGHEQLVEGHTVFAVIDIRTTVVNTSGNFTVDGLVSCSYHAEGESRSFLGLVSYPTHVDRVEVDCLEQHRVVVMPSPVAQSSSMSPLTPNGDVLRYVTPKGEVGYADEYTFVESWTTPDGREHHATRYAWGTDVMHPWTTRAGHEKNVLLPLPPDRLVEMQARNFEMVDASALRFA